MRIKCWTIRGGQLHAGIAVNREDRMVHVGEQGRGRKLTRVPVMSELGAHVVDNVVVDVEGLGSDWDKGGAVVLVQDHSGFRGGWRLTAPRKPEEYKLPNEERPERQPHGLKVIAEGYKADGIAGRMGGGPEYLLHLNPGDSAEIVRSGRLYGAPSVFRFTCEDDGTITVFDPIDNAKSEAARKW